MRPQHSHRVWSSVVAAAQKTHGDAPTPSSQSRAASSGAGGAFEFSGIDAAFEAGAALAQPLEAGAQPLNPIVLATQVWEGFHSATGLPWWASIPITTLTLRTLMLPLTLKAKAAALNFVLLQQASAASAALHEQQQEAHARRAAAAAEEEQRVRNSGEASSSSSSSSPSSSPPSQSRRQLAREYYGYLRRQHGTPSTWWFGANAFVQLNLFVSLSAALRQMAAALWPGLDAEGALWLADLTRPAVELSTWATPYGVNGIFLPLGVMMAYLATVERAAPVRGGSFAARALLVPR